MEVAGYYDGVNVRLLDSVVMQKNQRVIVKIADESSEDRMRQKDGKSVADLPGKKTEAMASFEALEIWRSRKGRRLQRYVDAEQAMMEAIDEKYGVAD